MIGIFLVLIVIFRYSLPQPFERNKWFKSIRHINILEKHVFLMLMLLNKAKQLFDMPDNKLIARLNPIHDILLKPINIKLFLLNHIDVAHVVDEFVE